METKQERENAESVIFSLQRKIGLYLLAGDTAEVDKIRIVIGRLQQIFGVTCGVNRRDENANNY